MGNTCSKHPPQAMFGQLLNLPSVEGHARLAASTLECTRRGRRRVEGPREDAGPVDVQAEAV
eukprot:170177-Pyramimonas_sp.AAC.1